MATLKLTALTLSLVHLSVIISGQDTVIITEPSDQTKDENEPIFLACQVQYLDRSTHVVSWILGNTIISDDGNIRTEALNDKLGEGAASRYQIAISVIGQDPRIYLFEMFITQAKGVDNGGELRCAVCPEDQNLQCNGSFEVESRIATLDVKYRPDTTLYPKCINPLGQTTTLTCESEIANPPVSLEWRKNTLVVNGTMPPDTAGMRRLDYEMNPAIDDDGAIFVCTVSSEYFDDLTDTQCSLPPVKVVSIPDVNIESPDQVVNGTRAEYTCSATSQTNAAMEAYAWTVEGLTSDRYTINNSNFQSVLTIKRIEGDDQGALVKCFVTDSDDQVGENQVMILIKGPAPPTGYTNPPGGTTISGGGKVPNDNTSLTTNSGGGKVPNDNTSLTTNSGGGKVPNDNTSLTTNAGGGKVPNDNTSLIILIGVVVAAVIILILIIAFIFWGCKRRQNRKSRNTMKGTTVTAKTMISMEPKPYSISGDLSDTKFLISNTQQEKKDQLLTHTMSYDPTHLL